MAFKIQQKAKNVESVCVCVQVCACGVHVCVSLYELKCVWKNLSVYMCTQTHKKRNKQTNKKCTRIHIRTIELKFTF